MSISHTTSKSPRSAGVIVEKFSVTVAPRNWRSDTITAQPTKLLCPCERSHII